MTQPNTIILYVEDIARSRAFYTKLFGLEPAEASPNFCAFHFVSGLRLGLWSRRSAMPLAVMTGGGAEVLLPAASHAEVDATYRDWCGLKLNVIQPPVTLEFGRTFLVTDPDGHRLRVLAEPMA